MQRTWVLLAVIVASVAVLAAAQPKDAVAAEPQKKHPNEPSLDEEYYQHEDKKKYSSKKPNYYGECPYGQERCDGECVDLKTSNTNCGDCFLACQCGKVCMEGLCKCPAGMTDCGGICQDLANSNDNCGVCGNKCPPGKFCANGQCVCPTGLTDCNGTCTDLANTNTNCGACGNTCTGGKFCANGQCVCPTGLTDCNGVCTDLAINPNSCGACGNTCAGGKFCANGQCVCPAGQTDCNGVCTDLASNPNSCGACNAACPVTPAGNLGRFCLLGNCIQNIMECFNSLGQSGNFMTDADYANYTSVIKTDPAAPTFGIYLQSSLATKFDFYTLDGVLVKSVWAALGFTCPVPPACPECANALPAGVNSFFYAFAKPADTAYLRMEVSAPCGGAWTVAPLCNGADVGAPTAALKDMTPALKNILSVLSEHRTAGDDTAKVVGPKKLDL